MSAGWLYEVQWVLSTAFWTIDMTVVHACLCEAACDITTVPTDLKSPRRGCGCTRLLRLGLPLGVSSGCLAQVLGLCACSSSLARPGLHQGKMAAASSEGRHTNTTTTQGFLGLGRFFSEFRGALNLAPRRSAPFVFFYEHFPSAKKKTVVRVSNRARTYQLHQLQLQRKPIMLCAKNAICQNAMCRPFQRGRQPSHSWTNGK